MCYRWSQTRSTSCTNLIFPVTSIKVCPLPIQNSMHFWWIEIKDIPKYKLYDNIGDFLKTTFWYHNYDTKRNPWVMLYSHYPISDSCSYYYTLPFILQLCHKPFGILQRVTKGQVMMYCKNFMTSTLLNIGPKVFSESGYRTRTFLLPHLLFFENNQNPFSWNLRVDILC